MSRRPYLQAQLLPSSPAHEAHGASQPSGASPEPDCCHLIPMQEARFELFRPPAAIRADARRLTEAAEKAKIELSSTSQTSISLPFITPVGFYSPLQPSIL